MKRKVYFIIKLKPRTLLIILLVLLSIFPLSHIAKGDESKKEIPIVMYHSLLKDPSRHGKYTISPDQFEKDILYLKENGYETILIQDLINYTEGAELPDNPIILTFDDGYYDNYFYGYPLAKKHDIKFIISPIGKKTDEYSETGEENPNYSYLTWERLKEMSDSGYVEIQSHSYDMHQIDGEIKGISQIYAEDKTSYYKRAGKDISLSREKIYENLGKYPTAFAFPFGAKGSYADNLIKDLGFSASLISAEKVSTISRDKDSLYNLGRFVRPANISSKSFFEDVMKLK